MVSAVRRAPPIVIGIGALLISTLMPSSSTRFENPGYEVAATH